MLTSLCILVSSCVAKPAWTTDYLTPPDGAVLEVGGMGFMSDGDMVVSTRRGQVWRIENPNAEDPNDASFKLICEGLHEGLGLAVLEDEIYIMQRSEVSKLLDLDGDELIDEVQTITQDFGMSGNYHEFGFGLPVDDDGNMYFSLNVGFWNPHWWHGKSRAPYRGWVLKLAPDGTVTPLAGGLRSPAGMGLLEDGTLLVTDNQGDWMPVCPVYAIKEGAFYGHPASLRWYEDQPDVEPSDIQPPDINREHPILWLPYKWSRSTGNVILDSSGGPFHGQYLIAELTNGQILRAEFEVIDGVLQGACWQAHKGIGSAYHIEYGPDGTLFAGLTNRGWGGLAPGSGIARIKHQGFIPLEIQSAHLLEDGFELSFTKPLASVPEMIGEKYDYNWWWEYGSPEQNIEKLNITNVSLAEDGLSATVSIDNLEAGKCIELKLLHTKSVEGESLQNSVVSYTINKMPHGELAYVAKQANPPVERGQEVEGWLYLTWADAFEMWSNNGVELCNADLDRATPTQFIISTGYSALVADEGDSMESTFVTNDMLDGEVKLRFMLAEDSACVIQLPNGMEYTLDDSPKEGYLGAGIWHDFRIEYQMNEPSIQKIEVNGTIADQQIHATQTERPVPLAITCQKGSVAFGDVRFRQLLDSTPPTDWKACSFNFDAISKSGDVEWGYNDGTLNVNGNGAITIPREQLFNSIRFDVKFSGAGTASIQIGNLEIDLATTGGRKTGGITGHPIKTNLVDQHEWCSIELQQSEQTTLRLNGVAIINSVDAESIEGDSIQINVDDAEVSLRQTYIK